MNLLPIHYFHKQLNNCINLDDAEKLLSRYLAEQGFTMFSFTCYPERYDYCSLHYKLWHQHYLSQAYAEIDSTLCQERKQNLPVYWDLSTQLREAKTQREQQMRLDSIEFGAVCGLSIPVHGSYDNFANLTLIQMKHEQCLANWEEKQYEWMLLTQLFFQQIQLLLLKPINHQRNNYGLSRREMECLNLSARDLSISDIAKQMNIKIRTVNFHLQRINKKLGVKNKHQAVIKALKTKLITN
jgi:LuxR family transcriptional activator of bioluminescence operon